MDPLFTFGQLFITRSADSILHPEDVFIGFKRHIAGDWGDLCDEDRKANDEAVKEGLRILSAYKDRDGVKFWIITEADRSVTTILLPDDY